jgi:hypothetical protein
MLELKKLEKIITLYEEQDLINKKAGELATFLFDG